MIIGGGGLGHIAIQLLAEMTPARVVSVDAAERGRGLGSEVGAEVSVDPTDAVETLTELTGVLGANVVIDFVAEGDTPSLALSLLGAGGTYYIVGYGAELKVITTELVLKEISNYSDLSELMQLVARDRIKLTTQQYTLDQAIVDRAVVWGGPVVG